jgi:hypothetical protein
MASRCSWQDGTLTADLRQPFDLLRETVAAAQTKKATEPTFDGLRKAPAAQRSEPCERSDNEWLPGQDSNLRQGG